MEIRSTSLRLKIHEKFIKKKREDPTDPRSQIKNN